MKWYKYEQTLLYSLLEKRNKPPSPFPFLNSTPSNHHHNTCMALVNNIFLCYAIKLYALAADSFIT
jgi:hypothetical protein